MIEEKVTEKKVKKVKKEKVKELEGKRILVTGGTG